MKELFKNIFNWIRKPDENILDLCLTEKLILLLKILLLDIIIVIPITGIIYLIHYNIVKLKQPLIDIQPFFLFLLVVLVAPLIEEFIFRFPLKYRRNYIIHLLNWATKQWFKKRWDSIFKYFLYLLIIAFGLIHLPNFDNKELIFYVLSPIIISGQLIGGIALSYIRIKLGFIWSIILHSGFNLFIVLISIIFYHNQSIINISSDDLTIQLTELAYIDKKEAYFDFNAENDLVYSIEGNDISLFRLIYYLEEDEPKPYDNTWIDVNIESKNGITKKELLEHLKGQIKFDK